MRHAIALAGALMMVAGPALAQGVGEPVRFSVGTVSFAMPVPEGYCVPEGEAIARMQRVSARDSEGVTALALVSCGEHADIGDFMMIKTSPAFAARPMTLAELMSDPTFANPPRADTASPGKRTMTRANGEQVEVEGGARGMGHDDVCGYVGGAMTSMGLTSSTVGCATVRGGRLIGIFFTEQGGDQAQLVRLRARARAVAMSIRPVEAR